MTTHLQIAGLDSNSAAMDVAQSLEFIPGVLQVAVDKDSGRATVQHYQSAEAHTFVGTLEDAGYRSKIIEA